MTSSRQRGHRIVIRCAAKSCGASVCISQRASIEPNGNFWHGQWHMSVSKTLAQTQRHPGWTSDSGREFHSRLGWIGGGRLVTTVPVMYNERRIESGAGLARSGGMLNRLTLWVVALVAGCGTSIQATMINPSPHAMRPRSLASVEIFSSGPPRRPYVDVAYLEAEQQSSYSFDDTADFLAGLREQAARMGCDGVVIGGVTHAADPVASVTANVNTSRKGLTATCIVYLPQAAATPSNPGASPPASTTATPPRSPSQP